MKNKIKKYKILIIFGKHSGGSWLGIDQMKNPTTTKRTTSSVQAHKSVAIDFWLTETVIDRYIDKNR